MTRSAPLLVLFTVLAATLGAQQPAARPTFHLPAGEYSLRELLDQTELATRAPIARSGDFEAMGTGRVRLQTGLVLDGPAWRGVLETLLHRQGFVLTFDPAEQRHQVVAMRASDTGWIAERAQQTSLAALFGGAHYGPVRVTVPTTFGAADAQAFIAPMFVRCRDRVEFAGEAGSVTVTGLAEVVRAALRMMANMDPALGDKLGAPAAAVWPRDAGERRIELAKGRYTARELVDRLAHELHCNVLAGEAADEQLAKTIDVDATRVLDAIAFEAAITRLLWRAELLVVGLPACPGLHEVIAANGFWGQEVAALATPLAAAEVIARQELVAYATVTLKPQHISLDVAQECLRKVMMGAPGGPRRDRTMTVLYMPSGLVFTGLTIDLTASLEALVAADVPSSAAAPAADGPRLATAARR